MAAGVGSALAISRRAERAIISPPSHPHRIAGTRMRIMRRLGEEKIANVIVESSFYEFRTVPSGSV